MNTKFKVVGLTRLGIKPESTAQEADALYHCQYFILVYPIKSDKGCKALDY